MFCAKCGVDLPDDARFCPQCGASVADDQPAEPDRGLAPQRPEAGPRFATPTDQDAGELPQENAVWEGGFSPRAMTPRYFLWAVITVVLLIVAGTVIPEGWTWKWYVVVIILLAGWGHSLMLYFYRRSSIRYRLTSQRLFLETGIFSRQKDELELVRVDDVNVTQNLFDRIFGVGNVIVHSTDATHPDLVIRGIDGPDEVKEHIREATRSLRKRVLNVESL